MQFWTLSWTLCIVAAFHLMPIDGKPTDLALKLAQLLQDPKNDMEYNDIDFDPSVSQEKYNKYKASRRAFVPKKPTTISPPESVTSDFINSDVLYEDPFLNLIESEDNVDNVPLAPMAPFESSVFAEPTKIEESVEPVESAKPVEPATPVESVKRVEPLEHVKPIESTGHAKSVEMDGVFSKSGESSSVSTIVSQNKPQIETIDETTVKDSEPIGHMSGLWRYLRSIFGIRQIFS